MHLIDYKAILIAVHSLVRPELDGIDFVEQASPEEQPKYPFATYTIINPYLNAKVYRSSNLQEEDIEIVISYTFLSKDSFETISLAQRMASLIQSTYARQKLQDVGIAVVKVEGFGSRDNFISIQTERQTGFDLRIRVRNKETNVYDSMSTIII